MKLIDAQMRLLELQAPVIQTSDASACLKISREHASKVLGRLAKSGIIIQLDKGLWAFANKLDPLLIPEYLTAPFITYISLQTALYYHRMIEQIPQTIYAVSLARTKKIVTPLATVSIHHIDPDFFFGFDIVGPMNIKMASPEKALLDILYLSTTRSLLFKSLPELELPNKFNSNKALKMIDQIKGQRLKTIVLNQLQKILDKHSKDN